MLLIASAGVVSAFQVGKAPMALGVIQLDLGLSLAVASWLIILTLSTVVVGLVELIIGGILPTVANDLNISQASAGP